MGRGPEMEGLLLQQFQNWLKEELRKVREFLWQQSGEEKTLAGIRARLIADGWEGGRERK